ncbi:MAG: hypothetical protein RLY45_777 [Actinomycetota bacterium]
MSPLRTARKHTLRIGLLAAAAVAVAGCAADGSGDGSSNHIISGVVNDPPLSVAGLSLPDATASEADFKLTAAGGGLLIVYFGYTACPDICPTTMHEVEVALREVGGLAEQVEVAMVTIDPARDEPQTLTRYVRGFVPDGHALRTTDDALLHEVAAAFGASFTITTTADGAVDVGHTPSLYAVDDSGTVVVTWPFGLPGSAIADDIEILLGAP